VTGPADGRIFKETAGIPQIGWIGQLAATDSDDRIPDILNARVMRVQAKYFFPEGTVIQL
jgi:proteasome assembly chaperone (PAC2) family protein